MGLETATYLSQLVSTNPISNDTKSQGDDHLRLLKSTLQSTFPNASKVFRFPGALAKTAAYTILIVDDNRIITGDATAAAFSFTLPILTAADDGWSCTVAKIDASVNAVTVVGTISGIANYVLNRRWSSVFLIWTGGAWIAIQDDVIAGLLAETASTLIGRGSAAGAGESQEITPVLPLRITGTTIEIVGGFTQPPQGRLTLTTLTPVLAADVTAATTIYFTPYIGNLVPIWVTANSAFTMQAAAELSAVLSNSQAAGNIYDLFVFFDPADGITPLLGISPVWGTNTAGVGARGTGAGTTEHERLNGLLVNKVSMSLLRGATTYVVVARQATYVGSVHIDGTNGQVSSHVTYGQNRKRGLWNAYNRLPIFLQGGDITATWSYATATYRQSRADTGNKLTVFTGLAEETFDISFKQSSIGNGVAAAGSNGRIGIGVNSTTVSVADGFGGASVNTGSISTYFSLVANAIVIPALGIQNLNMIEYGNSNFTLYGGSIDMIMKAQYRG